MHTNRGDECRIEIGLGESDRGHCRLVCGIGFVVVDGVAGVGQRTDAHAAFAAVGTDLARAVERGCTAGKRGPIRLDGVVQHFERLHRGIDADVKGESDVSAWVDAVGWTPAEDRPVGAQGRGVDRVRWIAAAHSAREGHVAAGQVVEYPQVVGRRRAGVGGRYGHREDIAGIGSGDRKSLGQFDAWFAAPRHRPG